MSLTLPQTCNMGSSQTGLVGTIGVTLLNPDGTTKTARTTDGIYEIGGGTYGKQITFDDNWSGVIVWDTGGATPYYAATEYNVEGMVDIAIESIAEIDTEIGNAGAGLTSIPWNTSWDAEVQSECIDALNDYDPPTKTELDNALSDTINNIENNVVEGTLTNIQLKRILLSALAGKSTGGGTSSVAFRDIADSKNRITANVDENGNRTSITINGS